MNLKNRNKCTQNSLSSSRVFAREKGIHLLLRRLWANNIDALIVVGWSTKSIFIKDYSFLDMWGTRASNKSFPILIKKTIFFQNQYYFFYKYNYDWKQIVCLQTQIFWWIKLSEYLLREAYKSKKHPKSWTFAKKGGGVDPQVQHFEMWFFKQFGHRKTLKNNNKKSHLKSIIGGGVRWNLAKVQLLGCFF